MHLKHQVENVYERQENMIPATTYSSSDNDDHVLNGALSFTHTRELGTTVPACIIQTHWQVYHPEKDFRVSLK